MIGLSGFMAARKRGGTLSLSVSARAASNPDSGYGFWWGSFHPSTYYVAGGGNINDPNSGHKISVYSFTGGDTLTEAAYVSDTGSGHHSYGGCWSKNGNYLFAGLHDYTKAYSWNGSNTLTEVESLTTSSIGRVNWISSDSDSSFLAISGNSGIKILSWNGSDTLAEVESVALTSVVGLAWSSDDSYLAVASNTTNKQIIIYSWNGSDTLTEVESIDTGVNGYGVCWDAGDDFLFATCHEASVRVYSWNGSDTLTSVTTGSLTTGSTCTRNPLFYNNSLIAQEFHYGTTPTSSSIMRAFSWNGSNTLTSISTVDSTTDGAMGTGWSSDHKYVGIGSGGDTTYALMVIKTGL